ncbi:hypothetical protein CLOP_g6541 [Closterium sp. NIES-67]|nr:hypothetical protein CLOP_g6541 [Closterium sp. NIES-67]
MFEHIKDLVEADDLGPRAWKLLRDVIPNALPMVIVLEKELAAISMRPGNDVKPVLDKIKDTYARMAAAGSRLPDPFWVSALRQVALVKNRVLATKLTVSRDVKFLESLYYKEWKQQQQKLPSTPLIVEADELTKNACLHGLTKHIRPKWHWVRRLLDKEVRLEIVKTHQQAADIFTKRLAEADHWKGMKLAGMSVH